MPAAKASRRTAGEGSGHTARMYVPEESHNGIVPMNHSNKDGKSLAESEEGRLLIKENTLPSGTYPTLSGSARVPRVGECADKLRVWPLLIRDKNRMPNERPSGSVRGAISNGCPYRDQLIVGAGAMKRPWRLVVRKRFFAKNARTRLFGE
jgi:hypothetical protein